MQRKHHIKIEHKLEKFMTIKSKSLPISIPTYNQKLFLKQDNRKISIYTQELF